MKKTDLSVDGPLVLTITVDKMSVPANGGDFATFTATVKDGTTGEEVPGIDVSWDTDFGNLELTSSTTGEDGAALNMLTSASAGYADVTASAEGQTVSAPRIEFKRVQPYPAPHLREAVSGNISTPDIGVSIVHVDIPASAVMVTGDIITLSWRGTLPDGSDGPQYQPDHDVTASEPGKSIAFEVPVNEYLMPYANGGELTLSYTVNGQPSDEERITVDYVAPPLEAPVVDQAQEGILLPQGLDEVTLTVPAWNDMAAGDQIIYTWQGTTAAGETPAPLSDGISLPPSMVGYPVTFSLDATEAALPFDGGSLEVWYQVTPADGSPVRSSLHQVYQVGYPAKLPLPLVEEAVGNVIDPDAVATSAHVLVQYPDMASGDVIRLLWQPYIADGSVGDSYAPAPHIVSNNDVSQGRARLTVPEAYLNPYLNGRVEVSYTVVRNGETEEKASEVASYEVHAVAPQATLRVVGARNNIFYQTFNGIAALDESTRLPVVATWQYEGEGAVVTGERFNDTQPHKPLIVTLGEQRAVIRPANLAGTKDFLGSRSACAVLLDDGTVINWGDADSGGLSSDVENLHDAVCIWSTDSAMAVLKNSGQVFAWGDTDRGGDSSSVAEYQDIRELKNDNVMFTGLRQNQSVIAWGLSYSADIPENISSLQDIVRIYSCNGNAIVLRQDGSVQGWGTNKAAIPPEDITKLHDIENMFLNGSAGTVLRKDGSVRSWGTELFGGVLPNDIAALTDIVAITSAYDRFLALRKDGTLVSWGNGGVVNDTAKDYVSFCGGDTVYSTLRKNGSITAWGVTSNGGTLPSDVASLTDIVLITCGRTAFAALRQDGSIVCWGMEEHGGALPDVLKSKKNIRAIYAYELGFMALDDDGNVFVWGKGSGFQQENVPPEIAGNISYTMAVN